MQDAQVASVTINGDWTLPDDEWRRVLALSDALRAGNLMEGKIAGTLAAARLAPTGDEIVYYPPTNDAQNVFVSGEYPLATMTDDGLMDVHYRRVYAFH